MDQFQSDVAILHSLFSFFCHIFLKCDCEIYVTAGLGHNTQK